MNEEFGTGKQCKQNDTPQKQAAKLWLEKQGYTDVTITAKGSDIYFNDKGVIKRAEVKGANSTNNGKRRGIDINYFGAATQTEIDYALQMGENYNWLFVFRADDNIENAADIEKGWRFVMYSTAQLVDHLYIPPMKYYIDLPALNDPKPKRTSTKEMLGVRRLTMDTLRFAQQKWHEMKLALDKMISK